MTSSMLSGERRWATSTRRGGKTVLGKVAVPKPINLPSQRLENHGLDPSVEIVPKGTHSWGSRPSSSTSNAWGTVSPGTEGGTGSPSHLSGRPSSGGSNTRPSTSSSDRAHEPNANAWGPNSRPSSASGALTSNQTLLTSLRPRSAETRPGSSQLSRFAEPLPENTGAWGAAGTPEILGAMASKNDGFSLSSGDFPTLGSEKDNSGRNIDSQDHSSHGRPVSSSGGVALPKEGNGASIVGDVSVDANVKSGNANSWRRDKCEDTVPSGVEKWQTDPQPYPNPSIPHHFEAWHGPPVTNPPGGVWFRGPPGGHPYGPPVGPGAFPMEPFPYYRPQMPATTLANPQPGPPPGGGPRGHHPNNGDLYRPHMTDAYIRPGMPIRPGFYPGPVAYEGYYGGPMGYCNSNDRDVPFMGMASGPPVYNRYSTQNAPEPSSSQGRSGGYGSAGKTMVPEHMESGHPHDTRGPYKVLLKQQNGWDGRNKERKWEGTISTDAAYIEKADQPGMSSWENDWRSDYRNDVEISLRQMTPSQEISSQTCDDRRSSVPVKVNSPKSVGNMKVSDDIPASNLECASSGSPEIPGSVSAVPKDSTLIKKIEGLNAKARAADGQHNIASVSSWEGQKKKFSVHNAKASHPADEGGRGFVYAERIHATGITNPASRETGVSVGDKSLESMAAGGTTISRSIHDMQGRGGNHGKGGHNGLEVDGWRKKAQVMETSVVSASRSDTNSTVLVHDHHTSFEASKKSLQFPRAREERESAPPVFDPSDNQAQHTKLRELEQRAKQLREEEEEERTRKQMAKVPVFDPSDNQAQHTKLRELEQRAKQLREEEEERTRKQMAKAPVFDPSDNQAQHTKLRELEQRAKQLREEEEERTRKQMAKARAKLEDLDRRKQSMKGPTQKSEASSDAMQSSEGSTSRVVQSPDLSSELPPEKPKSVSKEFVVQNQSVSFQHGADSADVTRHNNAPHIQDGDAPRQKRNGYREKQSLEKNSNVKSISTSNNEAPKNHTDASGKITVSVGEVAIEIAPSCQSNLPLNSNAVPGSSSFPMNANAMTESSVSQRKKNNKGGKNKHKVEVASSVATSQSLEAKEPNLVNASLELGKPIVFQTELDSNSVQSVTISKDENQLFEHQSSLPSEDSHGRANSQWKAQHSRRMSKNSQLNRSAEKFHGDAVWAPVGSQNKADADEASHKNVVEAITPFMKIDHQTQGNPKNKRAEIERYIPKPVAKEMAQQGSIQQLVASSGNQTTSDEVIEGADSSPGTKNSQPAGSAVGKVGLAFESRNGDGRQNKQGRAHGSWRQRGSTELVGVQSLQDGPSYPGQNVQNPVKDYQTQKLDVGLVKEQQTYSDEWNAPDGGNIPNNSDSVAQVAVTAITDQGVTGRAKRLPLKGHKGMGNNNGLDQKECSSGDADKIDTQSSSLEMSHIHLPTTSKDNRGTGERSTAHWQPKSQTFPANSQQGSRTNSVRSGGPGVVWTNKKESTPQGATVPLTPLHDKRTGEGVSPPCHDQFPSKKVDAEEALGAGGHREAKRGKKVGSLKGRPHSPNLVPVSPVEQAPGSMDVRQEQRSSSGFRKSGNQNNNRFSRLHESRGDWNSSGHDSKHNNPSSNWDRQRPNSHYEYQPVGPDNNNKSNIAEGPKDGIPNTGPRFRERGQNHLRHGGGRFYGRQGGTDRVDADYE